SEKKNQLLLRKKIKPMDKKRVDFFPEKLYKEGFLILYPTYLEECINNKKHYSHKIDEIEKELEKKKVAANKG
ncbi:MAG: hypothetical protein AB8G15_19630, partial [Saprospiraceae bacterium]